MGTTTIAAASAQRVTMHDPLALWHLLSLDAPTVAAVWTCFAAATFHVALPWEAPVALALAVWLMYAADRLSDARQRLEPLEERHRFHGRNARGFTGAMGVGAFALSVLLVQLPAPLRTAWMLLALPLLGYVAAVHVFHGRIPKEALVGAFFGGAILMPCLLAAPGVATVVSASLFGLLCWTNCIFIARAEGAAVRQTGRVTAWAARRFPAWCLVLAGLAMAAATFVSHALGRALCVLLSTLLLLLLDRVRRRVGSVRVRALADAALLTPLLVWPVLAHLL